MTGNRSQEDALFDDLEAEEERLAAEEQAELDAEIAEERNNPQAKAEDPIEAMHRIIGELQSENEGLKDKLLRTVAEMENLRRRTTREIADVRTYATANFARDMLSVSDNLRRATDAVPEEAKAEGSAGLTTLIEGVEMTEREMLNAMEKHGIKRLDPKGEKFNPNFHQAMFEVPNPDVPHNSVVEVLQEGYSIGERVLRPAMVGVAKGGPKFSELNAVDDPTAEPADPGEESAAS